MKKNKGLKTALIVLLCLIVVVGGVFAYYLYRQAKSGLFFEDTTINGFNVEGLTAKEVLLLLEKNYSAPTITVTEQGETALELTLEDMGYTINEMKLLSNIEGCMTEQIAGLLFSLMEGNEYEIEIPFDYDESVFTSAVSAASLAVPRTPSADAVLKYDEGGYYYIQPEVYGNELDDADLQVMVKDTADRMVSSSRPQEDTVVDIPESFYFLPAVTQDDEELNRTMNINNSFCKAEISLTFGDVKEVIDWSVIQGWLIIDGDTATVSEDSVYEYVTNLAYQYDTLYYPRTFETSVGTVIQYESSDYGYQIDRDAEAAQLIADIYSNTTVQRDPVYAVKGLRRQGADDLCGTYVEVNLTQQHVWFYKDGSLIIETDCVTGLPTAERETATGVFCIPYKKSPETLSGDTWEEEVTYWMPFHDGQGLHDAPWRSSFGGSIYQTNGSHGCVNLPANAAKTIYDNMDERTAIFLYK